MASLVFNIPAVKSELLNEISSTYYVRDVVIQSEIITKLQEARMCLKDEGAYFILDNFDTYYSVLHHADNLEKDVIFKAFNDLQKATKELDNALGFILEDTEDNLNDEVRDKMLNTLKMLIYIYTQTVVYLEQQKLKRQDTITVAKSRKASNKNDEFPLDKIKVLDSLNNIVQREINVFWNPPVVDHEFVKMFADIGFMFLQNPLIKQEKALMTEIFSLFGNLVKMYDFGETFVMRLIQTVRMYEHVVHCAPEGVQLMVEQFNCKALVHHFIKEATEWQVDDNTYQDNQGSRSCSVFLTELAVLMPNLMIPEVMYLSQYLQSEAVPLRSSVINVITEVILKVLTKYDLDDNEKESRDEFLEVIVEHANDVSAFVRAKVFQNLGRLQKKMAIPLKFQTLVLKEVTRHLYDKAVLVRKSAIACLTICLQHNPYGGNLNLNVTEEELQKKKDLLTSLESAYKEAQLLKIKEMAQNWKNLEGDLLAAVKSVLEEDEMSDSDDDKENEDPQNLPIDKELLVDLIRTQLKEKKYVDAIKLCQQLKDSMQEWKELKKVSDKDECALYMLVLQALFMDTTKITEELRTGTGMSAEDVKKIEGLEKSVGYLENAVSFLRLVDQSLGQVKKLLFTPTVSDMHEAIDFIICAYQFQIDNINSAVLEMLKIMQHNEPERKLVIVDAFKKIYLVTDAANMKEHTVTIIQRLIHLVKDMSNEQYEDMQKIVSEWTSKGILDNSVIDVCWQHYTNRIPTSPEDSRAVTEILRMAAIGRRTIITKNIKVVATIAFSDKGRNDMLFLANSCRLLAVAGRNKVDITSDDPPFKITVEDPMFDDLKSILLEKFFEDVPYFSKALDAALEFIFVVCAQPLSVAEGILKGIWPDFQAENCILVRFCELLGLLAIKTLAYLDGPVYRELKRRNNIRESRKEKTKVNKAKKKALASKRKSAIDDTVNESVLDGADAEDADAEFILNVLENDIVCGSGILGKCTKVLMQICERPEDFDDLQVQHAAVVALMRFMLVSSKCCIAHIRLLFTIFEKTIHPTIKCAILIHCSDFLTRFPNIVEPWTPKIFARLKDPVVRVRISAFYTLSGLILKDMIRVHSHISDMAVCIIDENEEVRQICKTFFLRLSQKENNLCNVVPDIFSHLLEMEIGQDDLRYIMKFLFEQIDKSKRMDNLVDRFCLKLSPAEGDLRLNRNIVYCLTLINYNDKALRKLHEKFPSYKYHVHDQEIYSAFKNILAEASKPRGDKVDLKPIVTEIENLIASVFETNKDGEETMRPPPLPKSLKIARGRGRKKSVKNKSDSEEEFDSNSNSANSARRKTTKRAKTFRKKTVTSSSDSE